LVTTERKGEFCLRKQGWRRLCFGGGGGGWGHERERMKYSAENNLMLRKYDKSVFLLW